jgi:hypothetical protein
METISIPLIKVKNLLEVLLRDGMNVKFNFDPFPR